MARRPKPVKRTKRRDDLFFGALEQGIGVTHAAKQAGYGYSTVYKYKNSCEEFLERWEEANEVYLETLEREADRRAVQGIDKPLAYKGEIFGHTKEYSDNLLMFRMKRLAPDRYRDNYDANKIPDVSPATPVLVDVNVVNARKKDDC